MSEPILETIDLRREFGALVAVNDVSLKVSPNTIHSIIGPNGAGKTTLFNLLSRNLPATSGKVLLRGKDISTIPAYRTAHLGIGRSFQITNLFPNLSVFENVRLSCQSLGKGNFNFFSNYQSYKPYIERANQVIEQVGLSAQMYALARSLPHGDQRKLELAMILAADPEVLLLDEPTAGMSAEQVPELMNLIQRVQQDGEKTVLLVEHNMSVVMNISDRITVMHHGEILAEGKPAEIAANEEVQIAYLGDLYRHETQALL